MSTEPRYQAGVLARAAIPRIQQEALVEVERQFVTVCESLPTGTGADVLDALRAMLAAAHLTSGQRAALIQPLMTHLDGLLQDTVPLPRRLAVVGAEA